MLTLGIDSSTQGTKAVVYDDVKKCVVASAAVNYGRDLPEFNSPDGFLPNADRRVRRADPRMWVKGLDLVLARLADAGAPMGEIAAIGGDAQQHATVYLTAEGVERLKTCALGGVEASFFARAESPIWMDSSTGAEVAALDAQFGAALQTRTGSPAIERFAASQVMKFRAEEPAAWAKTARVHLLSSFLTSYLAGADAPIETGDGAGMNLLNLASLTWDREVCAFVAPDLIGKMPAVHLPGQQALALAPRFAAFGLKPGIPVVPFTGDNPASLVGCGAEEPGSAVISLGTSDTFFAAMRDFRTDPDGFGHVFGNPMGGFMSLSCIKNGSLARERVKKDCGVDWTFFDETAFDLTPAGNNGRRAFPYFETEITPKHDATGIEANFDWAAVSNETKIRAIVEGQVANMRERTRWIGDFEKIFVTGGASRSRGIRSVIANIFKATVETLEVADSAAVGGARLARKALALVLVGACALFATAAEPVGALQIAAMKSLTPQVNELAAKANFPLLPMLLPAAIGESELAKKFGALSEEEDWGAEFYLVKDELVEVYAWPLKVPGVAAWQKAHPKKKIVDGVATYKVKKEDGEKATFYAAFSADGKWVSFSENRDLAKAAAAKGAPFAQPLKKGLASFVAQKAFFQVLAKEVVEQSAARDPDAPKSKILVTSSVMGKGKKGEEDGIELLPDDFPGKGGAPLVSAFAKEVESLRVVLGISGNGLDLRSKLTPCADGALAGASRALPAAALAFPGVPESAVFSFVSAPIAPSGELGKAWKGFVTGLFDSLCTHFEKNAKSKKLADNVEVLSFTRTLGYFAKGIRAFVDAPATCAWATIALAENSKNQKRISFRADGVSAAIPFTEAVPAVPAVQPKKPAKGKAKKEDEPVPMVASLRNGGGVFELVGEEKGFTAGKAGVVGEAFKKAIPEFPQTKAPLFAGRYQVGLGADKDKAVFLAAWLFGWRDGEAYRSLLRLPLQDLGKAFNAMAQMGGDDED